MNPDQKINICKRTRELAEESLLKVMKDVLRNNIKISEAGLRDMWLSELRKFDSILEDGWYMPPPHGIGVLIGSDEDGENSRLNYKSLRPEEFWPREDVYLNTDNGIIFAYASPVDKGAGIIGDFGTTIYFGKNKEIMNHLIACYQVVKEVFDYVDIGLTFEQIAKQLKSSLTKRGLNNEIECKTNPSPADDVGHTIPFVMEEMTSAESDILNSKTPDKIRVMISEKRLFVRAPELQKVQKGMAFTIEPRPRVVNNPSIPMVSFHSICAIHESGEKELITNFDRIFRLAGMEYIPHEKSSRKI